MENDKEFPVILGRNIGVSGYQGLSLQTRFNSTIRINPTYLEKINKDVLIGNVSANFAGSSTTLIVNPVHRQVISIAEIKSAASVGVFCLEAEMSISDDLQKCTFQIDLIDGSGSTTAFISGDPAEKLLSMKPKDIFDITCVKCTTTNSYVKFCLKAHAFDLLHYLLFKYQFIV
ncbi:hypothetical protein KY284_034856 [Solanum tuberosum]|nr:hypothetical protein KY284_034856 [Solanum tuberosum]